MEEIEAGEYEKYIYRKGFGGESKQRKRRVRN
jgi:hypothetical protein